MAESRTPSEKTISGAARKAAKTGASKATATKMDKLAKRKNGDLARARYVLRLAFKSKEGRRMRVLLTNKGESLTRAKFKGKDGKSRFGLGTSQKATQAKWASMDVARRKAAGAFLNTKFGKGKNAMDVGTAFATIHGKRGSNRLAIIRAGAASRKAPTGGSKPRGGKSGKGGKSGGGKKK